MKGQTAISSDELFGIEREEGIIQINKDNQKSIGSSLMDYALKFTLSAAEKAKQVDLF